MSEEKKIVELNGEELKKASGGAVGFRVIFDKLVELHNKIGKLLDKALPDEVDESDYYKKEK